MDCGSWWWTGRPGVLRFTGSQRVGHDWVTELNWITAIQINHISTTSCVCVCVCMWWEHLISTLFMNFKYAVLYYYYSHLVAHQLSRPYSPNNWNCISLDQHVCMLSRFSCVWSFETLWTVACQASPSMGFSRQKYWSGQPFPSPEDLPDPGIKPASLLSPAWQTGSLPSAPPGKPMPWPTSPCFPLPPFYALLQRVWLF